MSKDVILGDDVRESSCAIQYDKLMKVLIVPDNLINPIGDKIQVMVGFSGREEQIDFSILVLENNLCSIFVREDSEDRVIGLVFHDQILILDVIVLQS